MKDLLDRKREIIEKRLPTIIEKKTNANLEILKLLTAALKDRKIDAKVQFGLLDRLKVGGQIGSNSSINMDGQQRLDMARMWFDNAKAVMDSIDSDVKLGYNSYLKSIDEELEIYRDELKLIDEEIEKAEEEDKRAKLLKERKGIVQKK